MLIEKEMIYNIINSPDLKKIWSVLPSARLVGGCVRDLFLNKSPKDYDFATELLPEEVIVLFENNGYSVIPTGIQHGTVSIIIDNIPYEITTLRADIETDGRHATVDFVTSWEDDAKRRDFTFNALYMDKDGKIYDYFSGIQDIKNKRIKFIGRAEDRIKEDSLRILRFYRFMTKLDNPSFSIEDINDIINNIDLIDILSVERIYGEIVKIFSSHNSWKIIEMMNDHGISNKIFNKDIPVPLYKKQVDHLYIFSLIADKHDFLRKFKASKNDIMFINSVLNLDVKSDISDIEIKKLLVDHDRNIILCSLYKNLDIPEDTFDILKNKIYDMEIPIFEIKGRDIISFGYSGKEVGNKLSYLKSKWMESNFTLTKDILLTMI